MSWTTDNYPKDFNAALAAGWEISPYGYRNYKMDGKVEYSVEMRHKEQGWDSHPISMSAPEWLSSMIQEQRAQEKQVLQAGMRELLGLKR